MCAGHAVFFHTQGVSESKIVREMLCFTKETVVGGCEGRRCGTAVAAMLAYARLCSPMVAYARLSSDRSSIGKCKRRWLNALGFRKCWVRDCGAVLLGNGMAGFWPVCGSSG